MSVLSLACLAFLPLAAAFKGTVPVVIWSSHLSHRLDSLATHPEPLTQTTQLFSTLLDGSELCQYDAVVIVDHPGLHASDLRALSQTSYVSTRLSGSPSSLQIPYIFHSGNRSLDEFKRTLTDRCGARRVELDLRQNGVQIQKGMKHIVCVNMPHLLGESTNRKRVMHDHEIQLSDAISRVTFVFPSYVLIYAGSQPLAKRRDTTSEDHPSRDVPQSASGINPAFAPINTTLPMGNLLQRYRLFTPGLITALLVVFGLLMPILMVGIHALASIQSPLRMDAPKGPNLEKKNQ